MKFLCPVCLLVAVLISGITTVAAPIDDLAVIKARLRERYLAEWAVGSAAMEIEVPQPIDRLLQLLRDDGSFSDLDYYVPVKDKQVGFAAFPHVARLRKITAAHATAQGPQKAKLKDAIHRGLDFWIKTNPQTGHHWFVEIGAPTELSKIALMFEEELTPKEREGIIKLMEVSRREGGVLYYATKPATGQNLIWEANLQIISAALKGDPKEAAYYAKMAETEMRPRGVGLEGVQVDFSFHQHGPLLSSAASYGVSYVNDCARLIATLRGTSFAMSPDVTDWIVGMILDGQKWMIRGKNWDYNPMARNIVWPQVVAADIIPACEELAKLGGPRAPEFQALVRRLRGEEAAESAPQGNHLFWVSDYMTHAKKTFYASVKMSSTRTYGNESGNGQGEKTNYHLGDGAFALMLSGDEYRGIFPVWDWRRVPGITAVYPDHPQPPLPANIWGHGSAGGSDAVGGVSDGTQGVAAMDFKRGGAHGKKAWFFLNDAVVCLGAGLASDQPTGPLLTSVNQTWARGEIVVSDQRAAVSAGETQSFKNPRWVYHDGVAYVFLQGGDVTVKRETKNAHWQDINTMTSIKTPVAGDVFSVWFDHGRSAANCSYAYVILPGVDKLKPDQAPATPLPRIVTNTELAQVIASASGDLFQIVFWQAGEVTLPSGHTLKASEPTVLQLLREATGWKISAGNLTQKTKTLEISLGASTPQIAPKKLTFEFPEAPYAGRTLTQTIAN